MRSRCVRILTPFLVRTSAIEQAFQQLVILFKGDVPAVSAFETVADLASGTFRSALLETAESVRGGSTLAKALHAAMPWIGRLLIGLVEVGEANGSLPQMFAYASDILQRRRKLRAQVVRALTYPVLVVCMGLGVGYYVSAIAIPKIASVMGDASQLPPITRSLLDTSAWVQTKGYWIILVPLFIWMALALLRRVPGLGEALDRIGLHVPIFGKVGRYSANALLNHTLGLLVGSGISVVDALGLVEGTLVNRWYRRQVQETGVSVRAGRPFSAALAATDLNGLSPLTPALVRVGERSGSMDEGLAYVGDFYTDALERRLDLLGKLVEPALIIVVGGMVAFVYVAFFMGMAAMNAANF